MRVKERRSIAHLCTVAQPCLGEMVKWIACGDRFIEADVIRWREAVWKPKPRKNSRPVKIGERLVTAQVLKREPGGWVRHSISQCETQNAENWTARISPLELGAVVRRKLDTIKRGKPQRLHWTDETARNAVVVSLKDQKG